VNQQSELSVAELDAQPLDLLPAKETMWALFNVNVAPVVGVNISMAINAASIGATASSVAGQQITALQH
jgi:hypothetical protein